MNIEMERDVLISKCLAARTDQEIEDAFRDLDRWVSQHPEDIGILWCGEQMHMILTAKERGEMEDQTTTGTQVVAAVPAPNWYAVYEDGNRPPVVAWGI